MTQAEQMIVERIRESGPLPFPVYMSLALYHPQFGYYSSGQPRTGFGGHFLTSPELDPAFGELWAGGFRQIWDALGSPDVFEIVEIGPGEGGFAKAVLSAAKDNFARAIKYRLVERSGAAQQRQRDLLAGFDVVWASSLNDLPHIDQGVIVANEVLDNLPVHVVEQHAGQLQELHVGEKDGRLIPILRSPSSPELLHFLTRNEIRVPEGTRVEVSLAGESFVKQLTDLLSWGAIVLIDYGLEAADLARHPEGTIVCYSDGGTDTNPLERPGSKDITAHANWTSVRGSMDSAGVEVAGPVSQRDVMICLGLAEMDRALREEHGQAMVKGRGADAVRALSRRQALGALADPSGLGGLQVMFGLKEIVAPKFMRAPSDT